jgi:hypothetical protein
MKRVLPELSCPDYTFFAEDVMGRTFCHVTMHNWTPGVAKRFYREFQAWFDTLGQPVFTAHYEDQGDIHLKFLKRIGGIPIAWVHDFSGRPCVLYAKVK